MNLLTPFKFIGDIYNFLGTNLLSLLKLFGNVNILEILIMNLISPFNKFFYIDVEQNNFLLIPDEIRMIIIKNIRCITSEINFFSTCKSFYERYYYTTVSDKRLDCETLKQKKFIQIKKLYINDNTKINDLPFLSHLTHLYMPSNELIRQNAIYNLHNLLYLDISYNRNIFDISHLTSLTVLNAKNTFCKHNNINGLTNLTILDISLNVCQINIFCLINLKKLYANYNPIEYNSQLLSLTNLTELAIADNRYLNDIGYLTNLTYLNAQNTIVDQNSINKLCNLRTLDISNNSTIRSISHLTNLTELHIGGFKCKINQNNIEKLYSLTTSNYYANYKITSISHLTNLK